jgi:hypothetical protein
LSESIHSKLEEANERHEQVTAHRSKLVPLAAAIIAVLAALGTLFTHHASIATLAAKNEAILTQARASDRYNSYESKRVRYYVYTAMVTAGVSRTPAGNDLLNKLAEKERESSLQVLAQAERLEAQVRDDEERAEAYLKSYETLQVGTTLFDISIVLVSISALASQRILLIFGCTVTAVGLVFAVIGLLQSNWH